jgi:hypothetical protein
MQGEVEAIAALLMAVVVVGGFALLWVWLYPSYLSWEQRASRTLLEARLAARERLVVERVKCAGAGLKVSITNTGDVALRVLAVYVNESLAWSGALDLAPGANSLVTASASCGRFYLVKVCSARGNCWSFLEEEAWGG